DRQKVGGGIPNDRSTRGSEPGQYVRHDFRQASPQHPVDFQISVIALRTEADQRISAYQAAETGSVSAAGRHAFLLVNQQARQGTASFIQLMEKIEHRCVVETLGTRSDDRLGAGKSLRRDDGLESSIPTNPHLGFVTDMP